MSDHEWLAFLTCDDGSEYTGMCDDAGEYILMCVRYDVPKLDLAFWMHREKIASRKMHQAE